MERAMADYQRIHDDIVDECGLGLGWDDPPTPLEVWNAIKSKIRSLANGLPH